MGIRFEVYSRGDIDHSAILPVQFYGIFKRDSSPEEKLMLSILEQVFLTVVGSITVRDKIFDADVAWLEDETDWGPTSCAAICTYFDLDQAALRKQIYTWRSKYELSELPTRVFGRMSSRHQARISLERESGTQRAKRRNNA